MAALPMNRRKFTQRAAMLLGITALSPKLAAKTSAMKIHFLRHATFLLEINGVKFLIDPMLSAKEAMDPVANASNTLRIPMVDLPVDDGTLQGLLQSIDAVIVTHTHRDHWDVKAQELLRKDLPLICQPSDKESLGQKGFTNLLPVDAPTEFNGIKIYRTGGQHGTGEIGLKMGHVSGFVLEFNKKRIYIAGDTIWCAEVEHALGTYKPDFVVVNAGAAQFLQGGPITMSGDHVVTVCRAVPSSKVLAVHMDTVNHCLLKRTDLKKILEENKLTTQCLIPQDGELISL